MRPYAPQVPVHRSTADHRKYGYFRGHRSYSRSRAGTSIWRDEQHTLARREGRRDAWEQVHEHLASQAEGPVFLGHYAGIGTHTRETNKYVAGLGWVRRLHLEPNYKNLSPYFMFPEEGEVYVDSFDADFDFFEPECNYRGHYLGSCTCDDDILADPAAEDYSNDPWEDERLYNRSPWVDKLSDALWNDHEWGRDHEADYYAFYYDEDDEYQQMAYYERTGKLMHCDSCHCWECEESIWGVRAA